MYQSNRERSPFKVQRRLMGWISHHDPSVLHEMLGKPPYNDVYQRAAEYANQQGSSPLVIAAAHPIDKRYVLQAESSFEDSLRDVGYLFRIAVQSPDVNLVDAALWQTDEFVEGVANFARLPTAELDTYAHVQRQAMENGAFTMQQFLKDAYELVQEEEDLRNRGCPFAKPTLSEQPRDPLFDRFVRWGAQLTSLASQDLVTPELIAASAQRSQDHDLQRTPGLHY